MSSTRYTRSHELRPNKRSKRGDGLKNCMRTGQNKENVPPSEEPDTSNSAALRDISNVIIINDLNSTRVKPKNHDKQIVADDRPYIEKNTQEEPPVQDTETIDINLSDTESDIGIQAAIEDIENINIHSSEYSYPESDIGIQAAVEDIENINIHSSEYSYPKSDIGIQAAVEDIENVIIHSSEYSYPESDIRKQTALEDIENVKIHLSENPYRESGIWKRTTAQEIDTVFDHSGMQKPTREKEIETETEIEIVYPSEDEDPDIESASLIVEVGGEDDPESSFVNGRRIVMLNYFITQIQSMEHHPTFDCGFSDMYVIDEYRKGYAFTLKMKCKMCGIVKKLHSEPHMLYRCSVVEGLPLDVTSSAVVGALNAGVGLTALSSITSSMDIPMMASSTFSRHQQIIGDCLVDLSVESIIQANRLEKELAIKRGDISPTGVPRVPVVIDGAWCKRRFGNKGREATGGICVIIGLYSGQILFLAVMNSYCYICKKAENKGQVPGDHRCFKNWSESAQKMESEGARAGFSISYQQHGVHYSEILGDGEMSSHKKILEDDPYNGDTTVAKVECSNHLLRNFCTKLTNLARSNSKRNRNLKRLKNILEQNVPRIRAAVEKAAEHWRIVKNTGEAVAGLRRDVENAPFHVFGDHKNCATYFCNGEKKIGEVNRIAEMRPAGLLEDINDICLDLARHSRSLLAGRTTNVVESFNAMVAAHINGKRVNYTGSGGYNYRVCFALVSKNEGEVVNLISKKLVKKSAGHFTRIGELNQLRRRKRSTLDKRRRIQAYKEKLRQQNQSSTSNGTPEVVVKKDKKKKPSNQGAHYGLNAMKPDMTAEQFQEEKEELLKKLVKEKENGTQLELETRQQADSALWYTLRKKRITASNFGKICKMGLETNTCKTVNSLLYGNLKCDALDYGKSNEYKANKAVSSFVKKFHSRKENTVEDMKKSFEEENIEISCDDLKILKTNLENDAVVQKCGVYIHHVHPFLAASPDGTLGEKFLIELKCPIRCQNDRPGQSSEVVLEYMENGRLSEVHNYYYQVQGQLEMAQKHFCLFAVWSPAKLIINVVERDNKMWLEEMEPMLCAFYENCLLPEIVDSRKSRSMDIRNLNLKGEVAAEKVAKSKEEAKSKPVKLKSKEEVKSKPVKRKIIPRQRSLTRRVVAKKPKIEIKKSKSELKIEKRKKKASMKLSALKKKDL